MSVAARSFPKSMIELSNLRSAFGFDSIAWLPVRHPSGQFPARDERSRAFNARPKTCFACRRLFLDSYERHRRNAGAGLAVAKAVGVPFELTTVRVRGPLAWLPSRMQIWLPPGVLLRFVPSSEPLQPPWPRLIVSVGHQSVAPAVALKRLSNHSTFAVHVQDPKVSAHHFDWIAAPKHDGLTGPNVTTTLGAVHGVNPVRVAEAKEPFASLIGWLPRPRITVLRGKQPGFPRSQRPMPRTLDGR